MWTTLCLNYIYYVIWSNVLGSSCYPQCTRLNSRGTMPHGKYEICAGAVYTRNTVALTIHFIQKSIHCGNDA